MHLQALQTPEQRQRVKVYNLLLVYINCYQSYIGLLHKCHGFEYGWPRVNKCAFNINDNAY